MKPTISMGLSLLGIVQALDGARGSVPRSQFLEEIALSWLDVPGLRYDSPSVVNPLPSERPEKPVNSEFSEQQSDARYASSITAAIRTLDPAKGRDDDFNRRKPVYHSRFSGVVRPRGAAIYSLNPVEIFSADLYDVEGKFWTFAGLAIPAWTINHLGEKIGRPPVVGSWRPYSAVVSWGQKARGDSVWLVGTYPVLLDPAICGYSLAHYLYNGFYDVSFSDGVLSWTDVYIEAYFGNHWISHCELRLSPGRTVTPDPYGSFDHGFSVKCNFKRSWQHRVWGGQLALSYVYDSGIESADVEFATEAFLTSFSGDTRSILPFVGRRANQMRLELPSLRPLVHIVMHEALAELRNRGVNLIEPLAELDSLTSLYPAAQIQFLLNLASFRTTRPDSLKKYRLGRVRAVLHDVVDLLHEAAKAASGGYLLYKFGWSPQQGSVEDAANKLLSAADAFERAADSVRVRKTKNFIVNRTHTTSIRISSGFTVGGELPPFSQSLEAANASGLLPTFSRLYETQMFSWLLEYAVRIGFALGIAETVLWLILLRARGFEFGYTQKSVPSTSELAQIGFETDPWDPFTVILYNREVSTACPFLLSQIDPDIFEGDPQPDILAALFINFLT